FRCCAFVCSVNDIAYAVFISRIEDFVSPSAIVEASASEQHLLSVPVHGTHSAGSSSLSFVYKHRVIAARPLILRNTSEAGKTSISPSALSVLFSGAPGTFG